MGLLEAVVQGVKERAQRRDLARLQKARDMLEFQTYLRSSRRAHSTRDLAALVGVSQSTVAGQLTIAGALTEEYLERIGIAAEEIGHLSHGELLRVAKLPAYLRASPLRQAARAAAAEPAVIASGRSMGKGGVREARRAAAYRRMRDEGEFVLAVPQPTVDLSRQQAFDYLDDALPAVANLAEIVMGSNRTYYIGLTGNGGILVYLRPQRG